MSSRQRISQGPIVPRAESEKRQANSEPQRQPKTQRKTKPQRKRNAGDEQNRRTRREASEYSAEMVERLPRRHQERRESLGLSMYGLSLKCGVGRSTISELESGDRVPRLPVMFCLVKGLDWTLDDFFEDDMRGSQQAGARLPPEPQGTGDRKG